VQGNAVAAAASSPGKDSRQQPLSPEEEKPSRSVSNSLAEEYIHHGNILPAVFENNLSSNHCSVHVYALGDDHSSLHCPPPDLG